MNPNNHNPPIMSNLDEKPGSSLTEPYSASEPDSFSDIDEKKLLWKIDLRIIPLFTVLYLLSFLDRGNIGNAKIEGLAESLNLRGMQYNMCLTIFFIFYSSMEIPCNVVLRYVKPKTFIPITMAIWSVVMTLMGTVRNYHQLMAMRALLGIFEAALFPGISYILSIYYKKNEVLVREAIFFSAASMAGAFSGLLAAAISKMNGVGNYEGWRWIFILEGLLTFVVAVIAWFYFPLNPSECSFLTERERKFVVQRVTFSSNNVISKPDRPEEPSRSKPLNEPFEHDKNSPDVELSSPTYSDGPTNLGETHENDKRWILAVFADWQSWCMLMVYYGVVVPLYGISLFTPTIIKSLGHTNTKAQLMSVPIYVVASIYSIAQAWMSDRVGLRSPFLSFNFVCMAIGYTVCICVDPRTNPRVIYAASYIIAIGMYPAFPLVVIWFSNNLSGSYKRAVGMAFQIGIGNLGGAFASNFYRTQDSPRFLLGHSLELGFICGGFFFMMVVIVGYKLSNKRRRDALKRGDYSNYSEAEFLAMGDKSPHFTYRL
ncbi:hypothetical protein JCM33374_g2914 [Metschnikowia sp. JCM 33374]|nr:hypothetical protein JCM33374_g2914 [Metschnikowia sp. JCM 33374]